MRKNKKVTLFALLATLSVGAFGVGAATLHNETVSANTVAENFVMESGAGIRLDAENSGIRFVAQMDVVDTNASYGMIIVPDYYVSALSGAYVETLTQAGIDFINLENIDPVDYDKDGKAEIRGSIAKIKYENVNFKFTGIAYKLVDGAYTYAALPTDGLAGVTRSVANVASRALNTGNYDGETQEAQTNYAIMEKYIQKSFVNAAGYQEVETATGDATVYTYKLGEAEAVDFATAYAAAAKDITVSQTSNTLELLHTDTPTVSVNGGVVDLAYVMSTDNAALALSNGTVTANKVVNGNLTVRAGIFTKTVSYAVNEPMELDTEIIVDASANGGNSLTTELNMSGITAIYDISGDTPKSMEYADGKLGVTPKLGDSVQYAAVSANKTYLVTPIVSDYVIGDWATYLQYMKVDRATAMYAILTSDIERPVAGTTWANSTYAISADNTVQAENSVFNGRGHKISFIYGAHGWFGGKTQSNSTIKNVVIDGLYFHNSGALGSVLHNITLENVDMKVVIPDTDRAFWSAGHKGLLAARARNLQLIDCNIVFDIPDEYTDKELRLNCFSDKDTNTDAYYYVKMTNTHIVSNGKIAYNGEKDTHFNWNTFASEITLTNSTIHDGVYKDTATEYTALGNSGTTLATSTLGTDIGTPKKVYVDYVDTAFTYADGTITFASNVAGEKQVIVETDSGLYSLTSAFADAVIANATGFYQWYAYASVARGMYTVITFDGDWAYNGSTTSFAYMNNPPLDNSTLNGLGHTLSNICLPHGFWGTKEPQGMTMKNLNLNNLYFNDYSALGTKNCNNTTFENITMTAIFNANYAQNSASTLLPQYMLNTKFNNCNFTFKANDALKAQVLTISSGSGKSFTLNNTTINYDGFVALVGETPTAGTILSSANITMNGTSAINDQRTVVTAAADGSVTLDLATLGLTGKTVSTVSTGTLGTQTGDSVVITGLTAGATTLVTLTLDDATTKLVWLQVKAS